MGTIKWVDHSCELLEPIITESEAIKRIEYAYRICYNTNHKMDNESYSDALKFIKDKINLGHGSPLEHISISCEFTTTRSIANEIVRHRLAAYSQRSLRYCNCDNELVCILPPILRQDIYEKEKVIFMRGVENAYYAYLELRENNKIKTQFARDLLPLCTMTKIVCTWNLREIYHILDLRYHSKAAHPDLRYLMHKYYIKLNEYYPNLFDEYNVEDI